MKGGGCCRRTQGASRTVGKWFGKLRDVDLAVAAPMQLHEVGPGRDAIMAPEREAQTLFLACIGLVPIEFCPTADERTGSIGAHHPTRAHQFASHQRTFRMEAGDRSLPHHLNSAGGRMIEHDAMQMSAPDSVCGSARKVGLGACTAAHETNAAEGIR